MSSTSLELITRGNLFVSIGKSLIEEGKRMSVFGRENFSGNSGVHVSARDILSAESDTSVMNGQAFIQEGHTMIRRGESLRIC